MRSSTPLWLVVIIAVTLLAVWMTVANDVDFLGRHIKVQPGLDIQGGLRVLLAADTSNVDAARLDQARQIISQRVNALGVAEPVVQVYGSNRIEVELPGIRDSETAIKTIQQTGLLEFVDFSRTGSCTTAMPTAGQYILTDRQLQLRGNTQAVPTASVPGATAAAPTLLPTNVSDVFFKPAFVQATAQATVPATAALSATTAATVAPNAAVVATSAATGSATLAATAVSTSAATAAVTVVPPVPNGASKETALRNPCTGQPFGTIMDGSGLSNAQAQIGGTANTEWVVSFQVNDNSEGQKFGPFTGSHIQQPMAIVLDGVVLSAPTIQAALTTGGQITGNFDQPKASQLALQLKYGALPVALHIESTEEVGATLGAQSVAATGRAGVLGVTIVLIFMIVYYRIPGGLAALALLLFAAINFALYKYIPVTLTLPAVTGFLISIGTAVDGNILIFERIREELRLDRPLDKAIEVGFARAWPSIRDSNISTIVVGLILYFFGGQFGAGSVRGFAVTLILGLLTNLFTAVIVTRTLLNVVLGVAGNALRRNKWMIGV